MSQLSSVCLKTYSPSNSVAKPRQHRQQDPKTHKSSMDLGLHLSQYGASFILYQIPNLCTCHPCLLVPNKQETGFSPERDMFTTSDILMGDNFLLLLLNQPTVLSSKFSVIDLCCSNDIHTFHCFYMAIQADVNVHKNNDLKN